MTVRIHEIKQAAAKPTFVGLGRADAEWLIGEVERLQQTAAVDLADKAVEVAANLPGGTSDAFRLMAEPAAEVRRSVERTGRLTWRHLLLEDVYSAITETDEAELSRKLGVAAARIVAWRENLAGRRTCCDLHKPGAYGACCDPDDCGPCCSQCPTCPALATPPQEVAR